MRKSRIYGSLMLLLVVATLFSCRKKEDPAPVNTNTATGLKVQFSNLVGNEALVLDTKKYINAALDTYSLSTYNYYISNIRLTKADGTVFTEPESYHLIEQDKDTTRRFLIRDVPAGDYKSITFMVGVDGPRNTAGAQTGSLAPGRGMYWDWNTGYIMAKMEGNSTASPNANGAFTYHIAGFDFRNSVLKEITLPFPENAIVSTSNIPNVHIFCDANEWFNSPKVFSIKDYNLIMKVGSSAQMIADNYADMFHVDHVDN